MSRSMTKQTNWLMRPAKLRSAWESAKTDQYSLSAWKKHGSLANHRTPGRLIRHDRCPDSESSLGGYIILLVLTCCGSCCVVTFQLLGIGVMVVGIILKTNNAFLNDDVLNFLDQIVLGSLTLKDLLFIIIGVVIALGVFSILTSLVGGIGAILKVRVMLIIVSIERWEISRSTVKPTAWYVWSAKTQIGMSMRPARSGSKTLCCPYEETGSLAIKNAYSEDSDQSGWMPMLIWVFAGRIAHFLCFVVLRLLMK